LKNFAMISMLALAANLPQNSAYAQEPEAEADIESVCPSLLEQSIGVISACDAALTAERNLNVNLQRALEGSRELNKSLTESQDVWYRNPYFLISGGILTGIAVTR